MKISPGISGNKADRSLSFKPLQGIDQQKLEAVPSNVLEVEYERSMHACISRGESRRESMETTCVQLVLADCGDGRGVAV